MTDLLRFAQVDPDLSLAGLEGEDIEVHPYIERAPRRHWLSLPADLAETP
jgi:hypothetical protein